MPDERQLWMGLGCRRGASVTLFDDAINATCERFGVDVTAIAGAATLDVKQTEAGLLEFCATRGWPLIFFTRTELQTCAAPHPSTAVEAAIGVSSVCEAAALRAAAQTHPDALCSILVPKQILRRAVESGVVTMAIAQTRSVRR
ncbi:cobalamin biosynthesis protein [Altericista sp. CCNU0014]|uniref:cobalamin biosynthesis protein n=1 Tax=Altericista sp. CCNU0014 TaxID=3082949 RepID=UPI00384C152E